MPLTGCALLRRGRAPAPDSSSPATADREPGADRYSPALSTPLGRVLSHDPAARNVLIEFHALASPPADLAGRALVARHPETLAPTARLVAAPHRQARVFAAYVLEGALAAGDEVAIPPPF